MRQHLTWIQVHFNKQQLKQWPKAFPHQSSTIKALLQHQHPLVFLLQLPPPLLSLPTSEVACSDKFQTLQHQSNHRLRLRLQRSLQLAPYLERPRSQLNLQLVPCLEISKSKVHCSTKHRHTLCSNSSPHRLVHPNRRVACSPKHRHPLCSHSSPHSFVPPNRRVANLFSDRQLKQDQTLDSNKHKAWWISDSPSSSQANYLILRSRQPKEAVFSEDNRCSSQASQLSNTLLLRSDRHLDKICKICSQWSKAKGICLVRHLGATI